ASDNSYRINSIADLVQAQDVMTVEELRAACRTAARKLLGEHAGIAAFVRAGVSPARDLVAVGLESRLDLEQLIAADQAALHAELAHQFDRMAGGFEGFLVGVEV